MSRFLLFAALLFPAAVLAQEIVTLKTREGVTQAFFIASMDGTKAQAAALLFIGGGGGIRLRMEGGQPKFGAQHLVDVRAVVAGVVLSSSLFREGRTPVLSAFDFSSIATPLLFVHHREDDCRSTPYHEAARRGDTYPLVSVTGGKPPETGPCDPLAAHGYYGKEAETVDAIAGWMLHKPFRKEID